MSMEQAFKIFIAESEELLQDMEDRLLDIENSSDRTDSINSIFRAAHTIKGSAGLFGLDPIVRFTHVVENVLDQVRAGHMSLDSELVNLLLKCKDHIGKQIEAIVDGDVVMTDADRKHEAMLTTGLTAYLQSAVKAEASAAPASMPQTTEARVDVLDSEHMDNDNWHISIHFGQDVLRNGMDPLSFLRYLETIGHIVHIVSLYDGIPELADMDPETCYLAFEINFQSDADKATIENVFEFVRDDCQLRIIPPHGLAGEFIEAIDKLSNEDLKLGEILVRCGTLTQRELDGLLERQTQAGDAAQGRPKLGEIIINDQLAETRVVEAALNKQAQIKKSREKINQTVRVDADKLDHLINLIGELVIAGAGIESEVRQIGKSRLSEASESLQRLVEEVRDSALNLRMVQIGDTFNRFQRVVRDVSQELGKTIELNITGGETELDKTVIEKIGDPLMHLVRNSIDHGIEAPDIRAQRGKPSTGQLHLNAYHESGSIVIEVSDDGGGLNREAILNKAVERGLVSAEDELDDQQVYRLIFEAGFSTAQQVSNISGRGVGMDVVRRNIEALRGSIEIDSEHLVGTTIRIRLPLTLAIIDGFMMGVGNASYVVPLDIVEECLELTEAERDECHGRNFINLRGEPLPFIRLREHFHEAGQAGRRENIVVVKYGNQKAGFVVDQLMGELQTVIKPLGVLFDRLEGISGSTILGSGEVALILDAPALIKNAVNQDMR